MFYELHAIGSQNSKKLMALGAAFATMLTLQSAAATERTQVEIIDASQKKNTFNARSPEECTQMALQASARLKKGGNVGCNTMDGERLGGMSISADGATYAQGILASQSPNLHPTSIRGEVVSPQEIRVEYAAQTREACAEIGRVVARNIRGGATARCLTPNGEIGNVHYREGTPHPVKQSGVFATQAPTVMTIGETPGGVNQPDLSTCVKAANQWVTRGNSGSINCILSNGESAGHLDVVRGKIIKKTKVFAISGEDRP